MKKIILGAILLFSMTLFSQTIINGSVSLTTNSNLTNTLQYVEPFVNNCSIINGDLNLNGYTLYLKQNTNLTITGNLNGGGEIKLCNNGNNFNSISICSQNIQNAPILNGIVCDGNLSTPDFNFTKDYGYNYKVYDLLGRVLIEGITDSNTFNILPKNKLLILKVESFKEIKIYNN